MIASVTATCAVEVVVLGAGPAGIGAAAAAHAAGCSVLLIGEAPAAGGQIYRKLPDSLLPERRDAGDTDPDRRAGDALRRELSGSGVRTAFGRRVWSVMRSERGFRLDAISDGGVHAVEAPALLIATGAIAADLCGTVPVARASWSGWRARRFGAAMTGLTATKSAVAAAMPRETIVCRCEDVTRAEIDAGYDTGAREINQLKHFTRCGMGPCQGRICGEAVAELLALRLAADGAVADVDAGRRRAGQWTGRTPLRPVPLAALVGEFSYDDIPVPEPAPL